MSVVNLRLARKAKARAEREAAASVNRILHGRSRAERAALEVEASRATRFLDGHRFDAPRPADRGSPPDDGD